MTRRTISKEGRVSHYKSVGLKTLNIETDISPKVKPVQSSILFSDQTPGVKSSPYLWNCKNPGQSPEGQGYSYPSLKRVRIDHGGSGPGSTSGLEYIEKRDRTSMVQMGWTSLCRP